MPTPGSAPPSGGTAVVIAIGNEFRRDDGAGPAVLRQLRDLVPSGVDLVLSDGEPARLVEAWTGAALAIVVDAVALCRRSRAGSIVSSWTGRGPEPGGRPARTASAWMTRSAWRWPWTGCPAA